MWPALAGIVIVLVALLAAARPLAAWVQRRESQRALQEFRGRRELLEARFFEVASQAGKPRGLVWKECDWQPAVRFARDRGSRQLAAFVAVEIHFEAVERGDMEDVAAVGTVRDATAVFHFQDGTWGTGGRALFNMNPDGAAMEKLAAQFEPVASDSVTTP